jgi:hypothetical protein
MCAGKLKAAAAAAPGASLAGVRAEAVAAPAELAALCLERLLALGRSMAAQFHTGRPSDDGIAWPLPAAAKAALLQQQVMTLIWTSSSTQAKAKLY